MTVDSKFLYVAIQQPLESFLSNNSVNNNNIGTGRDNKLHKQTSKPFPQHNSQHMLQQSEQSEHGLAVMAVIVSFV